MLFGLWASLVLIPTFQASFSQHKMGRWGELGSGHHLLPTFLSPSTNPRPQPGSPPVGLGLPTPGVSREGGEWTRKEGKPDHPQERNKTQQFLPNSPERWQQTLPLLSCFPCGQLMATPGHARPGAVSVAGQLGSALGADRVCWVLVACVVKKKKNEAPSRPIHS